jgi:hypothetical protein
LSHYYSFGLAWREKPGSVLLSIAAKPRARLKQIGLQKKFKLKSPEKRVPAKYRSLFSQ